MKISVVIPLFNKKNTIGRAITSILNQTCVNTKDIDIIVVDDGSSDGSGNNVEELINTFTDRSITLIRQDNAGVSAARNSGVRHSKSPYVAFLDADDTYQPNFISEIDHLISLFPNSALFCTSYNFVQNGAQTKTPARVKKLSSNNDHQVLSNFFLSAARGDLPFCASSICIKRPIFWDVGGFPEGENMGEDQSLYCQVALNYEIAYSTKPCANYYCDVSGSLMQTHKVATEMPYSKRIQKLIDQREIAADMLPSVKQYVAGHLTDLVRRNLMSGNSSAAKQLLKDPRSRKNFPKWLYWSIKSFLSSN